MSWTDRTLRLLLADDNADHRALVLRELRQHFAALDATEVSDHAGLDKALASEPAELVITDYQMHAMDGLQVLRAVKLRWPECPVIMFTGTGSEEIAVAGMKAGLEDYVLKSPRHFPLLGSTVVSVLERVEQRRIFRQLESELRQSQEQVRHAQKMEAIGRLASTVAHDFNNLIAGILGCTELLLSQQSEVEPQHGEVLQIRAAAEKAGALARQLLTLGRKQPARLEAVPLNELLTGMDRMLRRLIGPSVELLVRLDPRVGSIRGDPGQLEQVLMNLALNARDAMPDGGRLVLETAAVELDEPAAGRLGGVVAGAYALLTVSDTGSGMDAETLAHLFEPFYTTKERGQGTGLGLWAVYSIVRQSQGHVAVQSQPGLGTTFRIHLPCAGQPRASEAVPQPGAAQPAASEPLLLVEDDLLVRDVLGEILRRNGYRLLTARSAEEALELVAACREPLSLVLTDVTLPGMSGPQLVRQLERFRPGLPVLLISGHDSEALLADVPDGARVSLLRKPFRSEVLLQRLRELLDGAEPG